MDKPNFNLPSQAESARFHIAFGWWSLLVFLALGIALEAFHAFKFRWYLGGDDYLVRRSLWRLAHAHGAILSLLHIFVGMAVAAERFGRTRWRHLSSPLLIGASILLPSGFFLAGIYPSHGRPGMGIYLVPVGALFLFLAILHTALCGRNRS